MKPLYFKLTSTGATTTIAVVPEALLLNGISKIDDHLFLIADSLKGVILTLDVQDGSVSIWLDHDLLGSTSVETQSPGVNGIKIHNNTAYISNTWKMLLVKIPFKGNGSAGKPEVIQKNVFIDDFTMDKTGNFYGATHVYDRVIKIPLKMKSPSLHNLIRVSQAVHVKQCNTVIKILYSFQRMEAYLSQIHVMLCLQKILNKN